ncbi:MAG: UbiA prenyltransferase family protein [Bacteroidota bacterium]
MQAFLRLMRPYQYVKNTFIFLPAFFALRILEKDVFWKTMGVFIAFSLMASAVYILNDAVDVEEDKLHPEKKLRPLASGKVSLSSAYTLMVGLILTSVVMLFFLDTQALIYTGVYLFMNILYTYRLKQVPVLDLFIIAMGFEIRILLGGEAGDIPLTMWIIIMTYLLALFLGLAKRRDDVLLAAKGAKVRKSIKGYNLEFINGGMMIMASVLIVSYISYTVSKDIQIKFDSEYLYITVLFVIMGIFRYMQITFVEKRSGNPSKILLTDPFLQLTILAWIITFIILIY